MGLLAIWLNVYNAIRPETGLDADITINKTISCFIILLAVYNAGELKIVYFAEKQKKRDFQLIDCLLTKIIGFNSSG